MQDLNKVIAEKDAEISRLRLVLQRIRRWGSPMIKGYIDAALVGRQAGGADPLVDDQVGEVRELEAQGMSEIGKLKAQNDFLKNDRDGYVQLLTDQNTRLTAEVERLLAVLRECEAELNAYYRMEYPGSHPHSQKELAKAMASNPATVALSGGQA
jgi:hypothetical protein